MRAPITGLRRFLKQTPLPSSIRCDGKKIVQIGTHSARWAEAERTITALDCEIVEALDSNGDVLRAFNIEHVSSDEPRPAQKEDWPESETAQIAQAITAACDRAASRHEAAYRMSFDKLSEMYQAQSVRLEEAIARNARLESALIRIRDRYEQAPVIEAEGTPADALIGTVLAQAASKMIDKPNGKSKDHGNS